MAAQQQTQQPDPQQQHSSTPDEQTFKGLTFDEFQQRFDEFVSQGYRPVDIRGFALGREARYDLTMGHEEGGGWMARHGLTEAQFRRENLQAERDGYELTVHSRFRVGRATFHAAVWEKLRRPSASLRLRRRGQFRESCRLRAVPLAASGSRSSS